MYYSKKQSYADPVVPLLIEATKYWHLKDWRYFRNTFWKDYYKERDTASRKAREGRYKVWISFKYKKLRKIQEYNEKA